MQLWESPAKEILIMADAQGSNRGPASGKGREDYQSDQSDMERMEQGVDSLGTEAAGAGMDACSPQASHLPAGAGHRELQGSPETDFTYRSDQGELKTLEEGTQLTEEGEAETGGGEVF
jgi:hypothetical protein